MEIRLQKFLAQCGIASRRNSEKILEGLVQIKIMEIRLQKFLAQGSLGTTKICTGAWGLIYLDKLFQQEFLF